MDTSSTSSREIPGLLPFRYHHPSQLGQLLDSQLHLAGKRLPDIRLRQRITVCPLEDRGQQEAAGSRQV